MIPIHIQTKIVSETVHIPELKALIGKTVEITVAEAVPTMGDGMQALQTGAQFDCQDIESIKGKVTAEQYEALAAIASAGGPDADAICRFRAASMP